MPAETGVKCSREIHRERKALRAVVYVGAEAPAP